MNVPADISPCCRLTAQVGVNHIIFGPLLVGLCFLWCSQVVQGQGPCTNQVTHLSGTVQIGCTNVTVTSDGSTSSATLCNPPKAPYRIGFASWSGSYTFTFSPPVSGVTIDIAGIENYPALPWEEEVQIEINGVFYPIPVPGLADNCYLPAIIKANGAIGANPGVGSWEDLNINTIITSIKLENVILVGAPQGSVFSLYFCTTCCETDAGQIVSDPLYLCPGGMATVPAATQTLLDNNDILQYILFSDLNDIPGSILFTSNNPSFAFDPNVIQIGVTYYIAAIAGNDLNGNVDLNDHCLDISNAVPVTWRPLPTAVFSITNPDVCQGACTDLTAIFTGDPPFTLTYLTPAGGPFTQTFSNHTGTFQVCAPANAPPGSFTIQATALEDAYCACP